MAQLPKIGNKVSLTEKAYNALKDAIMQNELKPGELLIEEKLAKQLDISRTPLRDALKKLAYEHLVDITSSRSFTVLNVTEDDIEEITVPRISLEPLAVKKLEFNIDKKGIYKLKEIFEMQKKASFNNDYHGFIQMEYEFHVAIAELTHNKWLYKMIKDINMIVQRYLIVSGTLNKYHDLAIKEHDEILNAIENNDYINASNNMKLHILNASSRMLK